MTYISIDIALDPEQLIEDIYVDMAAAFPGWEPAPANPETWMVRAFVYRVIVPLAELAADIPGEIFSRYGSDVVNVQIIEAQPATATTTWTMVDTQGYTIPAGTQVDIATGGDTGIGFRTVNEVLVLPGASSTGVGEVLIEAIIPGVEANGFSHDPTLVDALSYVASIDLVGLTSGGLDAEDPLVYLGRLADTMKTLTQTPIIARDVEILARNVPGVARATALDNFDPVGDDPDDPSTWLTEKTTSVAVHDADGLPCSVPVKAQVDAELQGKREANFVFHVIDPTYSPIDVNVEVVVADGFAQADVDANLTEAIIAFLSPAVWAQSPPGDEHSWTNRRTLYYQDLVTLVNNQEGVDRYTTLEVGFTGDTPGIVDLPLPGAAPLPRPGTITTATGTGGGGGGGGGGGLTLASITSGFTEFWSDPCTEPDPLVAGKFHGASVQTVDNTGLAIEYPDTLSSPHAMETSPSPRFSQFDTGGASGGGRYKFFGPAGDNIFSDGGRGRASIDYPKYDPGSEPAHIGPESGTGAGFFYEGRRYFTGFATRLSSPWNLDPPIDWRVIAQWKRNEWYNVTDPTDSPILALEQKNGAFHMIQSGESLPGGSLWSMDATGTLGDWLRFIFDITFSQDTGIGRMRVYGDLDDDGIYEYDSGEIGGIQTLSLGSNVIETGLPGPVAARFPAEGIESMFSIGVYEADGGDTAEFSDLSIWGTPGG